MEKHASFISYSASGGAIVGGFTTNDWGILLGVIVGVGTFLVNWYYKAKEDERKERARNEKP